MGFTRRMLGVGGVAVALTAAAVVPGTATVSDMGPREETETALAAAAAPAAPAVATPASAPQAAAAEDDGITLTHLGTMSGSTGGHLSIEGDRLYEGAYGLGMRIFSIADPANPVLLGTYDARKAEHKHARADAVPDATVIDGRHIVALGGTRRVTSTNQRTDVTDFVDVSDATNPVLLARFEGPDDGESHNSDIVDERALWLPTGGANRTADGSVVATNGLRIYDLRPLVDDEGPQPPKLIGRWDPTVLWEQSPHRKGRDVGPAFTHSHDVTVYVDHPVATATGVVPRDIALLAEGGSYADPNGDTGSVFVIDITDPAHPVVLNRWRHERGEKHHPIRYHHEAQLLDGDPSLMIVTDEDLHSGCNAGGATTVRLSPDLTEATELSEWFIGVGVPAPVCSTHVFSSLGNRLFIGSYNAGLQVVDLTDPAKPTRVAQAIPPGANSWGALVHETATGAFVYLGDFGLRGLDVYRVDPAG